MASRRLRCAALQANIMNRVYQSWMGAEVAAPQQAVSTGQSTERW